MKTKHTALFLGVALMQAFTFDCRVVDGTMIGEEVTAPIDWTGQPQWLRKVRMLNNLV